MGKGAERVTAALARWRAIASNLAGGRRYGVAALLGLMATLALPPLGLVPLLAPAFTGLVWIVDGCRTRRGAFAAGWWFGFAHFAGGIYWVSIAFLVEPEKFAWMAPFAVLGVAAVLALFPGLATLALAASGTHGLGRVLVFAAAWTAAEWLRGHVLTGFPWNLIANVWTTSEAMMQSAAIVGAYGLSLLTVAVAATPAVLGEGRGTREWRAVGGAAVLLAVVWAGGAARLAMADGATVPGVRLRLVQADIAQVFKWQAGLREAHFARQLKMSADPAAPAVNLIVWPETAVPFFLARDAPRRRRLAGVIPPGGALITGAPRMDVAADGTRRFYNSLHVLDDQGRITATYDKFHLVPFGEYVPLRRYVSLLGLSKLTYGRGDFTPGPGLRTVTVPGLPPFSPLICYEAIFPGHVVAPVRRAGARPQWLLNITNDAWFGTSSGPYQHFASARMRAVEEGLPLVRAANTGISAVVDAYGRVQARLGLGRAGVVDAPLPKPAATITPYARFGDAVPAALSALAAVAGLGLSRRRGGRGGRP